MRSAALGATVMALVVLAPAIARADAEAESLYREGKKAAQAKDWPTACAKFKASAEREAAPGTLLNLGDCEEHRGRLRAARESFESSLKMFKVGEERGKYARERLAAVDRRIPKLTPKLQAGSLADVRIEVDGAAASKDKEIALDPGEHVVVVRAPNHPDVTHHVTLSESESRVVVLAVGAARAPVVEPVSVTRTSAGVYTPTPSPPSREGYRTAGWVVLGVGAAGLATGVIAGIATMNAKADADASCTAGCTRDGLAAQESGKMWSAIATTAFIAGGAFAATGIGLVIFGSSSQRVGIGPGTLTVAGTF